MLTTIRDVIAILAGAAVIALIATSFDAYRILRTTEQWMLKHAECHPPKQESIHEQTN